MRRWGLIACFVAVATAVLGPLATASTPSSGTVDADGESVAWTGGPFTPSPTVTLLGCTGPDDVACDRFDLAIGAPGGDAGFAVDVSIEASAGGDDLDLYVYAPDGALAGSSASEGGTEEVRLVDPDPGTYAVVIAPYTTASGGAYSGSATLTVGDFPAEDPPEELDETIACVEAVPEAISIPDVTDDGQMVYIDVLFFLDGITRERAEEMVALANERSYGPLHIELRGTYRALPVPATGEWKGRPDADVADLFDASKSKLGGVRPEGIDLVYTLTNKDLYTATTASVPDDDPPGRDHNLLGQADCIGGVRFDDRAFGVGEVADHLEGVDGMLPMTALGFTPYVHVATKTTAHELGHLLGAHHHYFNCVEGIATELDENELSPCTLMGPYASFDSLNFDQLSGSVVRGHALEFAAANDAANAPESPEQPDTPNAPDAPDSPDEPAAPAPAPSTPGGGAAQLPATGTAIPVGLVAAALAGALLIRRALAAS